MPINGQKFVMHLSHEKASVLMKWAREWKSCRTFVHERFDLKVRHMTCPRSFCVEPSGHLPPGGGSASYLCTGERPLVSCIVRGFQLHSLMAISVSAPWWRFSGEPS